MTDRENVINELKNLHGSEETMQIISEAIAMLKEQPEPPHVVTCEECTHWDKKSGLSARWCETWKAYTMRREWCSRGGRSVD